MYSILIVNFIIRIDVNGMAVEIFRNFTPSTSAATSRPSSSAAPSLSSTPLPTSDVTTPVPPGGPTKSVPAVESVKKRAQKAWVSAKRNAADSMSASAKFQCLNERLKFWETCMRVKNGDELHFEYLPTDIKEYVDDPSII